MESIRKAFISIGFAGSYSLGLIDYRHILIKFNIEEDYVRAFLKRIYSIDGFTMRLFKWSTDFSVDSESAIIPIWINFPLLPLHFFNKEALYSIARLIGVPLKMDASTAALTRPSVARVCVELDLRKVRPEKIWLVNGVTGFWQPVDYEKIPPLCSECLKIGHQAEACRSTDSHPVPPPVVESLNVPLTGKIRMEYRPKKASVQNVRSSAAKDKVPHLPNAAEIIQPAANSIVAVASTDILKIQTSTSGSAQKRSDVFSVVAETNSIQVGDPDANCIEVAVCAAESTKLLSESAVTGSEATSVSINAAEINAAQVGNSGRCIPSSPTPNPLSITAIEKSSCVAVPAVLPTDLLAVCLVNDFAILPPMFPNLVNEEMDLIASCQALESASAISGASRFNPDQIQRRFNLTDKSNTVEDGKTDIPSCDPPILAHVTEAFSSGTTLAQIVVAATQPSTDDSMLPPRIGLNSEAVGVSPRIDNAMLNSDSPCSIERPLNEASAPFISSVLNPFARLFNPRVIPYAESSKSYAEAILGEKLFPSVSMRPHFIAAKSAEFPTFQLPQFGEFYPPSSYIPPEEPDSLPSRVDIYVFSDGDDVPRLPSSRQLLLASLQSFNRKLQTKFHKGRKFIYSPTNRKKWKKLPPISTTGPPLSSPIPPPLTAFSTYYGPNPNEDQSDDNAVVGYDNVWRSSSSDEENPIDFDYPLASYEAPMALEYDDFSLSPPRRRKYNKRFRDLPPALPTRRSKP